MNIQKHIEAHSEQFIELTNKLVEGISKEVANGVEGVELAEQASNEILYRVIEALAGEGK